MFLKRLILPTLLCLIAPLYANAAEARSLEAEHQCLALALYWEARGEARRGMVAVGWTILNLVIGTAGYVLALPLPNYSSIHRRTQPAMRCSITAPVLVFRGNARESEPPASGTTSFTDDRPCSEGRGVEPDFLLWS